MALKYQPDLGEQHSLDLKAMNVILYHIHAFFFEIGNVNVNVLPSP